MALTGNGTPRAPTPEPHPATGPRNTPAPAANPATAPQDPERTSHSRRQHRADLPLEDPGEEPSPRCAIPEDEWLGSDDFLPCLDMRAASVSVVPRSDAYDADLDGPAPKGPVGEISGRAPLTSAALAALPDTRIRDTRGWIESLQENGLRGAEGAGTWGHGEPVRIDAGGLVAMGGWCADEARGYPAVLRAEDVSTNEGMSEWVEVARDER